MSIGCKLFLIVLYSIMLNSLVKAFRMLLLKCRSSNKTKKEDKDLKKLDLEQKERNLQVGL
jgi:hypothetical protein